jgi:hypothetical protein
VTPPPTLEAITQYQVYRERLEQYLHLALIFQALSEGTCSPESLVGYSRADYALTIREVLIAWLPTFFDRRSDSLNAFELWPKLFPGLVAEIETVKKQLEPFVEPLRTFRNKVVFHAELDAVARRAARDAVFRPEVAAANQSFLSLCAKLLRAESSVPGLWPPAL